MPLSSNNFISCTNQQVHIFCYVYQTFSLIFPSIHLLGPFQDCTSAVPRHLKTVEVEALRLKLWDSTLKQRRTLGSDDFYLIGERNGIWKVASKQTKKTTKYKLMCICIRIHVCGHYMCIYLTKRKITIICGLSQTNWISSKFAMHLEPCTGTCGAAWSWSPKERWLFMEEKIKK